MKVVVDTNVLISATFWKGSSDKILNLGEKRKITILVSPDILNEYIEVLNSEEIQKKIKNKNLAMQQSTEKIAEIATVVHPKEKLNVVKDDPSDNIVLECALEGNADVIVSQDKHLLKLKYFEDIPIIHPDEFHTPSH